MDLVFINIIYLRELYNLSQKSLSKDLGVAQTTIGKYERGESYPPVDYIMKYCKRFGIYPNDLLYKNLEEEGYSINNNLIALVSKDSGNYIKNMPKELIFSDMKAIAVFVGLNYEKLMAEPIFQKTVELDVKERVLKEREAHLEERNNLLVKIATLLEKLEVAAK